MGSFNGNHSGMFSADMVDLSAVNNSTIVGIAFDLRPPRGVTSGFDKVKTTIN